MYIFGINGLIVCARPVCVYAVHTVQCTRVSAVISLLIEPGGLSRSGHGPLNVSCPGPWRK